LSLHLFVSFFTNALAHSALVNNSRKLTTDMAFRLAKAFDTSEEFWLNLQTNVDIWEVQNDTRTQEEISRIITLEEFLKQKENQQQQVA